MNDQGSERSGCMVPWCDRDWQDVHHICRGPARKLVADRREAMLHLCRRCHEEFGNYRLWPLVKQYAIKAIADGEWYDRVFLNQARGRAADAISEAEVLAAVVDVMAEWVWRQDPTIRLQRQNSRPRFQ